MNKMGKDIEVLVNEEEHLEGSISFKDKDYSFTYDHGVLDIEGIGTVYSKKSSKDNVWKIPSNPEVELKEKSFSDVCTSCARKALFLERYSGTCSECRDMYETRDLLKDIAWRFECLSGEYRREKTSKKQNGR